MDTTEEKAQKLKEAYDAFMKQIGDLEHERLEVMKKALGDLERDEIEKILQELKNQ